MFKSLSTIPTYLNFCAENFFHFLFVIFLPVEIALLSLVSVSVTLHGFVTNYKVAYMCTNFHGVLIFMGGPRCDSQRGSVCSLRMVVGGSQSCTSHLPDQQTSFCLTGATVSKLLLKCMSAVLFESKLLETLLPLQPMPSRWVLRASYFHLSACRSVGIEFTPLEAETLGGLEEDTIFTVHTLGQATDKELPLLTLPFLSGTSSVKSPLPSGVAMPVCTCSAIQLSLHHLTV